MALPLMTKILTENFGMEVVTPRVKVRKAGRSLELDVLAYANSECNAAYVVEIIKSSTPLGLFPKCSFDYTGILSHYTSILRLY